jgi:hypothetical protein
MPSSAPHARVRWSPAKNSRDPKSSADEPTVAARLDVVHPGVHRGGDPLGAEPLEVERLTGTDPDLCEPAS